jgi:uncharacterized protein (TIGR02453 family)
VSLQGFGEDAVEFYDGLAADNSKAYWTDHKDVYDAHVKVPMQALLDEVETEFGAGKIFRPYRDLRFARDKTPYKDHCGAISGEFYVQVGSDGLRAAAGYYSMAGDQVARYRAAVDDDRRGKDLVERLAAVADQGVTTGGETIKTRPRGFDPEHPRMELLRHKGLYGWQAWPPDDVLHERAALDRVTSTWRALTPLVEWLRDHVGPTEQARR